MRTALSLVTAIVSAAVILHGSQGYAATSLPAPAAGPEFAWQKPGWGGPDRAGAWQNPGAPAWARNGRDGVNGVWQGYARSGSGFLSLTNLTPATTDTGPDTVPPAKPAAPTFSSITTTNVNVFWPEATDNVEVTGYHLQQLIGGTWSTIRTVGRGGRFQTIGGLAAGTAYTFGVIAFDARGNTSPRSDPGTVTMLAHTANLTCRLQVITYNPSFLVNITIINTTPGPVSGWTIRFTAPLSTTIGQSFNGTITRNGTDVTLMPALYYATLAPGTQATLGFPGTSSGPAFQPPTGFTAAGAPCTT